MQHQEAYVFEINRAMGLRRGDIQIRLVDLYALSGTELTALNRENIHVILKDDLKRMERALASVNASV